jgi:hypothetical protein
MQPVSPVIPGFEEHELTYGKDQPEYMPLPALRVNVEGDDGIVTRWRPSWRERLRLIFGGDVFLYVKTFGGRLQPVMLKIEKPEVDSAAAGDMNAARAEDRERKAAPEVVRPSKAEIDRVVTIAARKIRRQLKEVVR